jgi:hypothetical protein
MMGNVAAPVQNRRIDITYLSETPSGTLTRVDQTPSAEAWFAGGERIGYDPEARAIVPAQNAPLKIFSRRAGDIAHAVTFLPGFPDGSFGWAKVLPHLPNACEMPKLFFDYLGMGDSAKPKDYAYSTAERADLVEALWRDLSVRSTTLVAFDFSSLLFLRFCAAVSSAGIGARFRQGRRFAASSLSTVASSQTGIPIRGTPLRCCAVFPAAHAASSAAHSPCSSRWYRSCGPKAIR